MDKFENAVYASSCGRPSTYIFVNAVKTLTSDVSASLFYRVRFQDGVHTSVELCHAVSSIIASIQFNLAIIDIQENDKRRRLNLSTLLSTTTSTFTRVKRLDADVRAKREDSGPDQVVQAPGGTTLQAQIDSACAFGL